MSMRISRGPGMGKTIYELEEEELTVDLFLDAYKKTGANFLQHRYREGNNMCPIAAMVVARAGEDGTVKVNFNHLIVEGFHRAVDELPPLEEYKADSEYMKGYALGTEVRKAIQAGALEEVPDYPPSTEETPVEEKVLEEVTL